MRFGVIIPRGTLHEIISLAEDAEKAGWDGVFTWDGIYIPGAGETPTFDPWVLMAGMAMRTSRVTLGAIIMPLSRRRPWKVAREAVTLDHLSNGRLVMPVGLGALDDMGFGGVGEPTDRKTRAELLDESLDILTGLWTGQPFAYEGKHYHLAEMTFRPTPMQRPRVPIWVVGAWPHERSLARAARYDGIITAVASSQGDHAELTPAVVASIRDWMRSHRESASPFEIQVEGSTPADPASARAIVTPWAEAGATWWTEEWWDSTMTVAHIRERILAGPPQLG
ncbi:MAG TPA: LLM class flavin-dependent oxidoreductase [Ktedonobacterales bacterium]